MSLGEFFWSLLVFYFIVAYLMILFRIIGDVFSDHEMGGLAKAAWTIFLIFLPFIAMVSYLIARGKRMTERATARAQAADEAQRDYIRRAAGSNPAAQIAEGRGLLSSGAITQQEFDLLKAKALA
jgi:hypothetical protein